MTLTEEYKGYYQSGWVGRLTPVKEHLGACCDTETDIDSDTGIGTGTGIDIGIDVDTRVYNHSDTFILSFA